MFGFNLSSLGSSPYVEAKNRGIIDKKCIPLCDFFNEIGFDTAYCCQGHTLSERFRIVFDYNILDVEVAYLIDQMSKANDEPENQLRGKFGKFIRSNGMGIPIASWHYVLPCNIGEEEKDELLKHDLECLRRTCEYIYADLGKYDEKYYLEFPFSKGFVEKIENWNKGRS